MSFELNDRSRKYLCLATGRRGTWATWALLAFALFLFSCASISLWAAFDLAAMLDVEVGSAASYLWNPLDLSSAYPGALLEVAGWLRAAVTLSVAGLIFAILASAWVFWRRLLVHLTEGLRAGGVLTTTDRERVR